MGVDVTLTTLSSGYNLADINTNFQAIKTALTDALSRSGDLTNTMTADLDMNSNQILNLPAPTAANDPVRLQDLGSTLDSINSIQDVTITSVADLEVLQYDSSSSKWINQTLAEAGISATGHSHATSDITSGTFADARIAESNVTQHEAALTVTESQISDLGSYIEASGVTFENLDANSDVGTGSAQVAAGDHTHATSGITSGTFADARIAESNVTQHEAALSITESQISDLGSYQSQGDVLDDLNTLGAATADGEFIVATAAGTFAYESGATARSSLGLGTADGVQFGWIELGHGSDTSITRVSSGLAAVEGDNILTATATQTITGKTIDGDNNTLSNLDLGNEVDWAAADDVTTASAFTSGDYLLVYEAGVGMRKVDYDDLPGATGGLNNIVEDTTPQLGGTLDTNGNNIDSITPTELGYLSGVTSAIQTQLGAKLAIASDLSDLNDASTARTNLGVAIGSDVQAYDADTLKADTADVLTAGFGTTAYNAGTKSTGTYTPDEANGNMQYAVNGGAHTLAPPTNNCTMIVHYTNNGSAGAITTSGFTLVDGDTPTTTDTHEFLFYIAKVNDVSHLSIKALQ